MWVGLAQHFLPWPCPSHQHLVDNMWANVEKSMKLLDYSQLLDSTPHANSNMLSFESRVYFTSCRTCTLPSLVLPYASSGCYGFGSRTRCSSHFWWDVWVMTHLILLVVPLKERSNTRELSDCLPRLHISKHCQPKTSVDARNLGQFGRLNMMDSIVWCQISS